MESSLGRGTTELVKSWGQVYAAEMAAIGEAFAVTGDGLAAAERRTAFLDRMVGALYREIFSDPAGGLADFCLLALGGYGHRELFPGSDIDLLFLSHQKRTEEDLRGPVAALARTLWDLGLKVGSTSRTLAECSELQRDNLEFNVALLDSRYLAGDAELFAHLRREVIPHVVARDQEDFVRNLATLTNRRHARYGHTIFHLEPDLKEAPGGLRDYQVARWLDLIRELANSGQWPVSKRSRLAVAHDDLRPAVGFLAAARCFLHLRQGRDDNHLTYEFQQEAADRGLGCEGQPLPAADWMRCYFRHARDVHRQLTQVLEETTRARSSLYAAFLDWRSRLSNADFSVLRGRIFPRQASPAASPERLLALFELVACHGLELSREAESWVEATLRSARLQPIDGREWWPPLRRILSLPYTARALRAMHRVGLLTTLFPAWQAIDALVIRDFYHRYTVDEHTLVAIEHLDGLKRGAVPVSSGAGGWEGGFAEIMGELEHPEWLLLATLFHDVGKGLASTNHIQRGLAAVEEVVAKLALASDERAVVRFLIASHLEMSATLQRRDIFDPETVRAFAEKVGSPERLKMLCLLTYADIKAVNPEALTPWKAELLWRLFAATLNHLQRSLDDQRVHASTGAGEAELLAALPPEATPERMMQFLEGLPKRYLATHSWEEIATHFKMFLGLDRNSAEIQLRGQKREWELTVITRDRAPLFSTIAGALAAWGMNILKADAFANASGVVVDTFRFTDLHGTLALNPSEVERFRSFLQGVLEGSASFDSMLAGRVQRCTRRRTKVKVPAYVGFDDESSSHSTLLEIVAEDRPGLLYQISTELARLGCNIEVALINTEGQKALDVFYLTVNGRKLGGALKEGIQHRLEKVLSRKGA